MCGSVIQAGLSSLVLLLVSPWVGIHTQLVKDGLTLMPGSWGARRLGRQGKQSHVGAASPTALSFFKPLLHHIFLCFPDQNKAHGQVQIEVVDKQPVPFAGGETKSHVKKQTNGMEGI